MLKSFHVKNGLIIGDQFDNDNGVGLIKGSGAPGGDSGEQDDSGLGMVYVDTATGDLYKKQSTSGNDSSDWAVIGADQSSKITGITSNSPLDDVFVRNVKGVEWEISVEKVGEESSRVYFKLFLGHNATQTVDATTVDYTEFAFLSLGNEFNYSYTIALGGTGAAQQAYLNFNTTEASGINVTARRTDLK